MYDAPSIVGTWVYVESTTLDRETPMSFPDFEEIPPRIEIRANNTLEGWFWTVRKTGVLIRTGVYAYVIAEHSVLDEDGEDYIPDTFLDYDPETGLLRYAFPEGYHFFERD